MLWQLLYFFSMQGLGSCLPLLLRDLHLDVHDLLRQVFEAAFSPPFWLGSCI